MIRTLRTASSLNTKSLYISVLALLCAGFIFFSVRGAGKLYIENSYMSSDAISARKSAIYHDFISYVSANSISGRDWAAVAHYTDLNQYVTILVYRGSSLDIRAKNGQAQNARSMEDYELSMYANQYGSLYPLRFSDGLYQIAIGDSSQERVYLVCNIVASATAALFCVVLICLYTGSLSRRIIDLSKLALKVGGGELDRCISAPGNDEISQLAKEIDNMRRSLICRMNEESRAWQANSELITAISHDIRTPMTSMIGYLGLLNDEGFDDAERSRQYTASAYAKAMELKDLTDELFKYFLVFGRSELDMHMEVFDGRLLFEQLISEAEFELIENGFEVKSEGGGDKSFIKVDPLYLKRVFDNLVSNAKKYADKSGPIEIKVHCQGGQIFVSLSNRIRCSMARVESTRIGLRTCEKIITHMSGTFSVTADEHSFKAELALPVYAAQA